MDEIYPEITLSVYQSKQKDAHVINNIFASFITITWLVNNYY